MQTGLVKESPERVHLGAELAHDWDNGIMELVLVNGQFPVRPTVPPALHVRVSTGTFSIYHWAGQPSSGCSQYADCYFCFRVSDNDEEFMLIEAADHLPAWLNPETAEKRVKRLMLFMSWVVLNSLYYHALWSDQYAGAPLFIFFWLVRWISGKVLASSVREPRIALHFTWLSHTSDLKNVTLVATLSGT